MAQDENKKKSTKGEIPTEETSQSSESISWAEFCRRRKERQLAKSRVAKEDQELLEAISRAARAEQKASDSRKTAHKKLLLAFFDELAKVRQQAGESDDVSLNSEEDDRERE